MCLHAYPDPAVGARRVSELAKFLATSNWDVHVIADAGPFQIFGGELSTSATRHGVRFRTPLSNRIARWLKVFRSRASASTPPLPSTVSRPTEVTKTGLTSRMYAWARHQFFRYTLVIDDRKLWSLEAGLSLRALIKSTSADCVFISGPPFSVVAACTYFASRRVKRLVIDLRDPWVKVTNPLPDGYSGFQQIVDKWLERYVIRSASAVTTTSVTLTRQLSARYPELAGRFAMIRNGYEEAMLLEPPIASGRLQMLYAGTIYLNRNPFPLLGALAKLVSLQGVDRRKVQMVFVGDCRAWQGHSLLDWVQRSGLEDVVAIRDPVPASQISALIQESNVLVNFAQKQRESVPAKLFEQIASRRDILLVTEPDSESALTSESSRLVHRVDDDEAAILFVLENLYYRFAGKTTDSGDVIDVGEFSRTRTNQLLAQQVTGEP